MIFFAQWQASRLPLPLPAQPHPFRWRIVDGRRVSHHHADAHQPAVPAAEISIQWFGESNPLVQIALGMREPQDGQGEIILKRRHGFSFEEEKTRAFARAAFAKRGAD